MKVPREGKSKGKGKGKGKGKEQTTKTQKGCRGIALLFLLTSALVGVWHAVAQLVEALRYKPAGRGFNSRLS